LDLKLNLKNLISCLTNLSPTILEGVKIAGYDYYDMEIIFCACRQCGVWRCSAVFQCHKVTIFIQVKLVKILSPSLKWYIVY